RDLFKKTAEENDVLMPRINDALLAVTKETAFIGLELFANEPDHLIQGAKQAHDDIANRIKDGVLQNVATWMDAWPFKENTTYSMLICKVEKKYLRGTNEN
ncbi:MAG: hypothetical protein K6B75_02620, partial [Lachnospiraceae bacterium]|nr:hypothetical protein [Lachnospiraceae bacterium]